MKKFKLHPVKRIETFHSEGHKVHDLTIKDNSSYVAEDYVVHNSMCTTRIRTGHGIPTLQSIMDCSKSDRDVYIVADGGIKNSGDFVKALAAGADMVMLGSVLAGHDESPGSLITKEHQRYKKFRGMASREAQLEWRGKTSVVEGESTLVPYKGSLNDTLVDLLEGVKSGLSYSGARTIREFRVKAKFLSITSNSVKENGPHGK